MRQKQNAYDKLCKTYGKADLDADNADLNCCVAEEEIIEVSYEVSFLYLPPKQNSGNTNLPIFKQKKILIFCPFFKLV